jgi:hypothetical protein
MRQMNMDGMETVEVNYESSRLSDLVKELRPVVYKDGDSFCCLLGPHPATGIFGCGMTQKAALADWELHLHQQLSDPDADGEVIQYVRDTMETSKQRI